MPVSAERSPAAEENASRGWGMPGRYVGIDIEQVPVLVMGLYLRDPAPLR